VAVVGLVLGVGIDRHHTAQVRVAEARHRLEAVAVVQSLSPRVTGRGLIVDLDVQLYNAGPRPIDVEVTPDDPPPAGVRVEVLTGSRTVPSGGAQAVTVRVPVDCSSSLATEAALAVRTADGTQHRLPLRSGSGASFDQTDQQGLCQMLPDRQQLNAQLAGSLTEPVLALTNNTDGALMVSIDSASPMTQVSSHRLSFTTVPALPLKLAAHSSRTVRISVGVPGCIIGDDLPALSGIGYLGLRGDDARGVQLTAAGVDVGALVGGAIARTCH
jgi:hypothetical protein